MATALQMISWGVEGQRLRQRRPWTTTGQFVKVKGQGVTDELWAEMVAYATEQGWKAGDYKKLNLPFENKLLGQPGEVRERMSRRVEDFVYGLLTDVFNAGTPRPWPSRRSWRPALTTWAPRRAHRGSGRVDREQDPGPRGAANRPHKGPEGDFED